MAPTKTAGKMSSGNHKIAKLNRQKRRLKMKINRWNRYSEEIANNKRKGSAKRWNTAGLQKHLEMLEGLI